ncbi:UDP-N-acetylmuramate--L-alanine ligase [Cellulomonas hominis]
MPEDDQLEVEVEIAGPEHTDAVPDEVRDDVDPVRRSVLLAGGGTAGHVNPLLAVAEELRRREPDLDVTVLGTAEGLEARLVPERGFPLAEIPRVPLPRRPTTDWFHLPRLLRSAVETAGHVIDETGALVVVGFGGYVATPAYLAARARGIPVVVHEQNARPGLANRLGARRAAAVAVTFPGTRLPRAVVTGLPLRPEIAGLIADRDADAEGTRRHAAAELGLDPARPTLLVTGGSLGAVSVNTAIAGVAADIVGAGAQVLHLTGAGKAEAVRAAVRGVPGAELYHVREYLSQMQQALAVADVVLARSGAGTVSEVTALGLPAVYVPLPVGNGEQRLNAAPVVSAGGGLLVTDGDLTAAWLRAHLLPLLVGDAAAAVRARMGAAAAVVGIRDAAARVADLVQDQLDHAQARAEELAAAEAERAAAAQAAAEQAEREAAERAQELADQEAAEGRAARAVVPIGSFGRTHLVGVGGAGMSVVAELLAGRGVEVTGSDAHDGPTLAGLRRAGVQVWVGHTAEHVDGADTVVVSTAVRETNPELARARELGLAVLHRSQALAALMAGHDVVAVAGAHGKTTTSAMVAAALVRAGLDPSCAIGGSVLTADGPVGGARSGGGVAFVAEADESDGSFLAYTPTVAVVTNVEPDHLDHYGSAEAFERAFVQFAGGIVDGGLLVACTDDAGARRLVTAVAPELGARGVDVVTYGTGEVQGTDDTIATDLGGPDVRVGLLRADDPGGPGAGDRWAVELTSTHPRVPTTTLRLAVPGAHNALNATAAYVAATWLGADADAVVAGLADFRGTGRRFEARGEAGGVRVVDDYAHHPTEVAALLRTARQLVGEGRVLVLFQPHLYSRTRTFADQFGAALDLADQVVVTDVYAAREDPDPAVSGALIVDRVPTPGRAVFVADRLEAAAAVAELARPGDMVLTVGAGDVTELGPVILTALGAEGTAGTTGSTAEVAGPA